MSLFDHGSCSQEEKPWYKLQASSGSGGGSMSFSRFDVERSAGYFTQQLIFPRFGTPKNGKATLRRNEGVAHFLESPR